MASKHVRSARESQRRGGQKPGRKATKKGTQRNAQKRRGQRARNKSGQPNTARLKGKQQLRLKTGHEDMAKKGRPRASVPAVDKNWIHERRAEVGLQTQGELARVTMLDTALMTKSLNSQRAFSVKDVANLAAALKVTTDDIVRKLGYKVEIRGAPVAGKVMGDARVSSVVAHKGSPFRLPNLPAGAEVLMMDTEGSPLAAYNGAAVVYLPSKPDEPVPLDAFGRLCIVEADNNVTPFLGTLGRGTTRSTYSIELFGTREKVTVQTVHRASPVHSIHLA